MIRHFRYCSIGFYAAKAEHAKDEWRLPVSWYYLLLINIKGKDIYLV